jgi:hypothetical protein
VNKDALEWLTFFIFTLYHIDPVDSKDVQRIEDLSYTSFADIRKSTGNANAISGSGINFG